MLTGVRLTLLGRAKVHWSVKRGKNNRVHYRSEEIYVNERVYVFGSRKSIIRIISKILRDFCKSAT